MDDAGKIVREVKVASKPEALLAVLKNPAYHIKRIGLEAGPLSQWLFRALAEADMRDLLLRADSSDLRHDRQRYTSRFTKIANTRAHRRFYYSIRRLDVCALGEFNCRCHVVGEELPVLLRVHLRRLKAHAL